MCMCTLRVGAGVLVLLLLNGVGASVQAQEGGVKPPAGKEVLPDAIVLYEGAQPSLSLHITKDDLLPMVSNLLTFFVYQQGEGAPVISGQDLSQMVSSLTEVRMVEYEIVERAPLGDVVKFYRAQMSEKGWKEVFWSKNSKGSRENLIMVQPPRNEGGKPQGIFLLWVREKPRSLKVTAVKTKGMLEVTSALGALILFMGKPSVAGVAGVAGVASPKEKELETKKPQGLGTTEKKKEKPGEKEKEAETLKENEEEKGREEAGNKE